MAKKFSQKLCEIQNHLDGIKSEIEQLPAIPDDAMTYSELKMQLMINYVANLVYYLSLKQKGESVAEHPVFKHLAYLRTFMERLTPLDAALKYQIDRLLLQNTEDEEEDGAAIETPTAAGPNLSAFVPMKSAVKGISVEQVKKSLAMNDMPMDGRLEIDPSMIAAQIAKIQESKSKPKTQKRKEESDFDQDDDFSDVSEVVVKKRKKTTAAAKKQPISDDDESIDSEDI